MRRFRNKMTSLIRVMAAMMACVAVLGYSVAFTRATNSYKPVDAYVPFSSEKADVENGGTYEFVIEPLDENSPKPMQDVIRLDGSGSANFGIRIDEPGTYEYNVYEKAGNNSDIVYDDTVYLVTLFVTNGENGELDYQIILTNEDKVKPTEMKFVNSASRSKKKMDPIVKTGDMESTWDKAAWVLLIAGALLLLLAPRRKEAEHEN